MTTKVQLLDYLYKLLEYDYGEIEVEEHYGAPLTPQNNYVEVVVTETTLRDSMFNEKQMKHIIDALTPVTTRSELTVVEQK